MFVLGIQGSPREKGNTDTLLSEFMKKAAKAGAVTRTLYADRMNIKPCKEIKLCETKGLCPIKDDMGTEIYSLLWKADLIVMATPVFFYSVPAQLKSLIDRSQTLWARKHMLKLEDPGKKWRSGFLVSVGATKGNNLFEGINLTAKYFFDAVGAGFKGSLEYRKIENPGDIIRHPTALKEVRDKADELIKPYMNRKRVLFACRENACRSQMAQAFAQISAGDRLESISAGDSPAENINGIMTQVMAEKGIDMAFRKPESISNLNSDNRFDIIVTMGCEVACPVVPGAKRIEWDLPDPAGKPVDFMRELRDSIEIKIKSFIDDLV